MPLRHANDVPSTDTLDRTDTKLATNDELVTHRPHAEAIEDSPRDAIDVGGARHDAICMNPPATAERHRLHDQWRLEIELHRGIRPQLYETRDAHASGREQTARSHLVVCDRDPARTRARVRKPEDVEASGER